MTEPQWKGPSSVSGTCLSWTTCHVLKSGDAHPCNKQKGNKTTSHQELPNVSDPTSDSGAHSRWADSTQSTAVGSPCPASAPAAGCFRTAATCRPGLSLEFDILSSQSHELPWNKPPPAQSSVFWAPCSTSTTAVLPPLLSPRTHLARVSGLIRILKYLFFSCSVIISKTAGVKLKSVK